MISSFRAKRIVSSYFLVVCLFVLLGPAARCDDKVFADLAHIEALADELRSVRRPNRETLERNEELIGLALKGCNPNGCAIDDRIRQRFLQFILDGDAGGKWAASTAFLKLGNAACPVFSEMKAESKRLDEEFQSSKSFSTGYPFRYHLRLTVGELEAICQRP